MLTVVVFDLFLTGILVFVARLLGKTKGMWTMITVMAALWLAGGVGWAAGQWSGILGITMPSLIILIAGLLALPPYVLPVPALPWRWPSIVAALYTLLWLVSVWLGWLEMNAIGMLVFLPGLLVIFRPAFPLENAHSLAAIILFGVYGIVVFSGWRVFRGFEIGDPLNLLVLVQGLLALSCYLLPMTGKSKRWAVALAVLFGIAYLAAMAMGSFARTLTNVLILPLGVMAFLRFALPKADIPKDDRQTMDSTEQLLVAVIFLSYALIWAIGLATEELAVTWFNVLVFAIGWTAIFMPVFVRSSKNWETLKAIITYNLGTNYPYSAVPFRELVTRVQGNAFRRLFAGPGIVLTNADHVVAVYSGDSFERVSPPGVTFTHWKEQVQEVVDLRPQVRAMPPIVVTTQDGIDVEVIAATPFRIATDGQEPELGRSFPYDEEAVFKAVHAQRVDQVKGEKQGWDRLVRQTTEREMRDIIVEYSLDELSSLDDHTRDPRGEIAARMRDVVRKEIQKWGMVLIGGGIGNLKPPQDVIDQRIEHWKAHWQQKIEIIEAEAEAEERQMMETARAEAQLEMIQNITEGLDQLSGLESARMKELTVLRLLDAIEKTASDLADSSEGGIPPQRIPGLMGFLPPREPPEGENQ